MNWTWDNDEGEEVATLCSDKAKDMRASKHAKATVPTTMTICSVDSPLQFGAMSNYKGISDAASGSRYLNRPADTHSRRPQQSVASQHDLDRDLEHLCRKMKASDRTYGAIASSCVALCGDTYVEVDSCSSGGTAVNSSSSASSEEAAHSPPPQPYETARSCTVPTFTAGSGSGSRSPLIAGSGEVCSARTASTWDTNPSVVHLPLSKPSSAVANAANVSSINRCVRQSDFKSVDTSGISSNGAVCSGQWPTPHAGGTGNRRGAYSSVEISRYEQMRRRADKKKLRQQRLGGLRIDDSASRFSSIDDWLLFIEAPTSKSASSMTAAQGTKTSKSKRKTKPKKKSLDATSTEIPLPLPQSVVDDEDGKNGYVNQASAPVIDCSSVEIDSVESLFPEDSSLPETASLSAHQKTPCTLIHSYLTNEPVADAADTVSNCFSDRDVISLNGLNNLEAVGADDNGSLILAAEFSSALSPPPSNSCFMTVAKRKRAAHAKVSLKAAQELLGSGSNLTLDGAGLPPGGPSVGVGVAVGVAVDGKRTKTPYNNDAASCKLAATIVRLERNLSSKSQRQMQVMRPEIALSDQQRPGAWVATAAVTLAAPSVDSADTRHANDSSTGSSFLRPNLQVPPISLATSLACSPVLSLDEIRIATNSPPPSPFIKLSIRQHGGDQLSRMDDGAAATSLMPDSCSAKPKANLLPKPAQKSWADVVLNQQPVLQNLRRSSSPPTAGTATRQQPPRRPSSGSSGSMQTPQPLCQSVQQPSQPMRHMSSQQPSQPSQCQPHLLPQEAYMHNIRSSTSPPLQPVQPVQHASASPAASYSEAVQADVGALHQKAVQSGSRDESLASVGQSLPEQTDRLQMAACSNGSRYVQYSCSRCQSHNCAAYYYRERFINNAQPTSTSGVISSRPRPSVQLPPSPLSQNLAARLQVRFGFFDEQRRSRSSSCSCKCHDLDAVHATIDTIDAAMTPPPSPQAPVDTVNELLSAAVGSACWQATSNVVSLNSAAADNDPKSQSPVANGGSDGLVHFGSQLAFTFSEAQIRQAKYLWTRWQEHLQASASSVSLNRPVSAKSITKASYGNQHTSRLSPP